MPIIPQLLTEGNHPFVLFFPVSVKWESYVTTGSTSISLYRRVNWRLLVLQPNSKDWWIQYFSNEQNTVFEILSTSSFLELISYLFVSSQNDSWTEDCRVSVLAECCGGWWLSVKAHLTFWYFCICCWMSMLLLVMSSEHAGSLSTKPCPLGVGAFSIQRAEGTRAETLLSRCDTGCDSSTVNIIIVLSLPLGI